MKNFFTEENVDKDKMIFVPFSNMNRKSCFNNVFGNYPKKNLFENEVKFFSFNIFWNINSVNIKFTNFFYFDKKILIKFFCFNKWN